MILRIQRGPGRAIAVTAVIAALLGLGTGYMIWGFPNRNRSNTPASAVQSTKATTAPTNSIDPKKATPALAIEPPCKLKVSSKPIGATVKLGSKLIGKTPVEAELPCQTKSLTVAKAAFTRKVVDLQLKPNEPNSAHAELERRRLNVTIKSKPNGATVLIGGENVGKTPVRVKLPMAVETKIVLKRKGFRAQDVKLTPKKSTSVSYRLRRR